MKKIILATGNKAKIAQIEFVKDFYNIPIQIIQGKNLYGDKVAYDEVGSSTEEIAITGALEVAKKIDLPVITEDTDFKVNALDGFPGLNAGKFQVEHGRGKILEMLEKHTNRKCSITSSCAYATPDGEYKCFTNTIYGVVAKEEAWGDYPNWVSPEHNVFGGGYNAIFIPDNKPCTLAQISPEDALPWSYRENTFYNMLNYLVK